MQVLNWEAFRSVRFCRPAIKPKKSTSKMSGVLEQNVTSTGFNIPHAERLLSIWPELELVSNRFDPFGVDASGLDLRLRREISMLFETDISR
jgi:hypothetical protein